MFWLFSIPNALGLELMTALFKNKPELVYIWASFGGVFQGLVAVRVQLWSIPFELLPLFT